MSLLMLFKLFVHELLYCIINLNPAVQETDYLKDVNHLNLV